MVHKKKYGSTYNYSTPHNLPSHIYGPIYINYIGTIYFIMCLYRYLMNIYNVLNTLYLKKNHKYYLHIIYIY